MGLLVLAAALVLFIFLPELNVVVLAITLAILFNPVYTKLRRVMPRLPSLAAFLTVRAFSARFTAGRAKGIALWRTFFLNREYAPM